MRILIGLIGAAAIVLGGLWFVQGLGIVEMRPLLCFAACTPVRGPSMAWTLVGGLTLAVGTLAVASALRPR
jgi:hypothetical protein